MLVDPAAVLWDFDGTLVDSEPVWAQIEAEMLTGYGVVWGPEEMRSKIGQHAEVTTAQMAEAIGRPELQAELHHELHERVADRLTRDGLPWLPGALELLDEVTAAGIRSVVVTASTGLVMDAAARLLPEALEFVITADDVSRTKPDPECYELAMARLGVTADEVIILEDSVPGTAAGLASGAFVYAVPALAILEPHPRLHVAQGGLTGTTLAELTGLWRQYRKVAA